MKHCLHAGYWALLIVLCASAGPAFAAPGNWQDPTGGWEAVYEASSGLFPWELPGTGNAVPWDNSEPRLPANTGYQTTNSGAANYASLGTDSVTGEAVLVLNHTNNTVNPSAILRVPPGSGATSDQITMDIRFRLFSDLAPETTPPGNVFPLFITIARPPSAAQLAADPGADEQFIQIRFRANANMTVLGADGTGAAITPGSSFALGKNWHDLRIHFDADGGAQFFFNGADTPEVFTGGLTTIFPRVNNAIPAGLEVNEIQVGDLGSGVTGQVSIAHIKVTSSEFAAVTPEPAVAAMLLLGLATAARRREGHRA